MVELKTAAEIEQMRAAGRVVAAALAAVRKKEAAVGVSLRELDEVARDVLASAGAVSLFEGYQPGFAGSPFSGVICTSVNDAVLHGLPSDVRLADGDLLNVDCGASVDGWCADAATSFVVGTPRAEDLELIATTEQALDAGIAAARPGARLGDIGAAIGEVGRAAGVGTNLDFGGHGIGRRMHEEPARPERRPAGPRPQAPPGPRDRDRAVVLARHRAASTSSTRTAGPSAPPTAPAAPTPNTPSPSPRTARGSSPPATPAPPAAAQKSACCLGLG